MKNILTALTLLAMLSPVLAHDGHDHQHDEKKPAAHAHDHKHDENEKAPNGGRLLKGITPHAEFLFTKERRVEIRFVDGDKVIAPSGQIVTVITGDRSNPTRLKFEADGDKLVSTATVPEGNNLPVIVRIQADAKAKTVTERFTLNLAECSSCDYLEYACVCSHGH